MLNWRTLGVPEKATSTQNWFYVSLAMLALDMIMVFMGVSHAAINGLAVLFLIVWYFSNGRAQSKYVKEKFGSSYARKPWGKALLIGIAALVGFFIAAVIVGIVLGALRQIIR